MQHYSHFNKLILNPIQVFYFYFYSNGSSSCNPVQRNGSTGDGRNGFISLKGDVLDKVIPSHTHPSNTHPIPI